ncbi:MAG: M23 family metallopeptidase [Lachnospiraceae bacterium]|nr:M23 family metallopeptidase [Lachnospiraceae bacterium]
MKNRIIKRTHKRIELSFIFSSLIAFVACLFFLEAIPGFEHTGDNTFYIYLNGEMVGVVDDEAKAEHLLIETRRQIAAKSKSLIFMTDELFVRGEERLFGKVDSDGKVMEAMGKVLKKTVDETMQRTCTVKIEEYMVTLKSLDDVEKLLQAALDLYDQSGRFKVELSNSNDRDFNVITPKVIDTFSGEEITEEEVKLPSVGASEYIGTLGLTEIEDEDSKDFEDYELGVLSMNFLEEVEISQGYLPSSQVMDLNEAIENVTKEQETPGEYEIKSGDTLSGISMAVNIPMENLVALNPDKLETVNSTIHVGDILTITVPEPELSVERVERIYVEEVYDADVIYVDNDEWYTTQTKILQQPSSGYRKAILDKHFTNEKEISREVIKEQILLEAVPKIVERGTKIPPTYIKPISGGRISSYFGYRKSPGGIGSTYHKGVDWYVPLGTPVYASSGGTVRSAGWGSGYGYVVYIDHPDGRQTRYAHCSKLVVSAGQYVNQGDLIAYSGSTGNSTGPHLHFEMRINGTAVNPLDYL